MLIQKGNREDAIHALMNTWLKLPQRWCLNCEREFDPVDTKFSCCENPYYTTNSIVFKRHMKEMDGIRETRKDKFASTGSDTGMRYLLRFPPGLLQYLEMSMKKLYHEKLFTKEYDQKWFAKKFGKYFCIAEEI